MTQVRLRDRVWLWGHPAGAAEGRYAVPTGSRMTPVEGVDHLGARNVYFVPWVSSMDLEQTTAEAEQLDEVGWSIERGRVAEHGGTDNVDEIGRMLDLAQRHPVVGRVVYDDFFGIANADSAFALAPPYRDHTPAQVRADRLRLSTNADHPLGLWLVLYAHQQQIGQVTPYVNEFSGVCLWFWRESEVTAWDAHVERFLALTEGQERQIGVYLYNFGEDCPASAAMVRDQLDRTAALLRDGTVDGIVLHTNVVADVGLEAAEAAHRWMVEHGDEVLARPEVVQA